MYLRLYIGYTYDFSRITFSRVFVFHSFILSPVINSESTGTADQRRLLKYDYQNRFIELNETVH